MQNQEIWKDVVNFNDYEVSNFGNLRKKLRPSKVPGMFTGGNYVSGGIDGSGYIKVKLWNKTKTKGFSTGIHRLVAEAFIPNPDNKAYVNHINGIKTDNKVENLEWATPSENVIHAIQTGLLPVTVYGSNHHLSKLDEDDIRQIRAKYLQFVTIYDLAKEYSVVPSAIDSIIKYKTWKHVDFDNKDEYLLKIKGISNKLKSKAQNANPTNRKLSDKDVLEIRRIWKEDQPITRTQIAKIYGVGIDTISDVIYQKTFKHLTI